MTITEDLTEDLELLEDEELETDEDVPQLLSAKDVAARCKTDAKSLRKFLRTYFPTKGLDTPGQGGRYGFTEQFAAEIVKAFNAASAPKPKVEAKKNKKVKVEDLTEDDDVEDELDEEIEDLSFENDDEVEELDV